MSLPPSEPYQAEDAFLSLARTILEHTPFTFLCLVFATPMGFGGRQGLADILSVHYWIFFVGPHSPLLIMVHTGKSRWIKEMYACPIVAILTIFEWLYFKSIPVSESNLFWAAFLPYGVLKIPVCFVVNLIFVALYFWGAQALAKRNAKPDAPRQERHTRTATGAFGRLHPHVFIFVCSRFDAGARQRRALLFLEGGIRSKYARSA